MNVLTMALEALKQDLYHYDAEGNYRGDVEEGDVLADE